MATIAYKRTRPNANPFRSPRSSWGNDGLEVSGVGIEESDFHVGDWKHIFSEGDFGKILRTRVLERSDRPSVDSSTTELHRRLGNANRHFKRKASEVFSDGDAIRLLANLYESINIDIEEFDTCQQGISLAKLAAANFCEIGARAIYITESGQKFLEALNRE